MVSEPSGSNLPTPSRDLPTFFTWESPSPFQILPTTGLLEPGQACRITVTFQPLMAVIYDVQATCWYGEGSKQKSSIQLQAVGEARPLTRPLQGSKPQCAPPHFPPHPPPCSGLHGTSSSLLPSPEPCRLCLFSVFLGVADQCFPGDPRLL